MSKAEKIKAEIERRYEYWKEKESNSHSIESESRMSECQHLLLLFNSLQEEPVSNDLEEAAHFYVDTTIEWFDSEGNPCCYPAFIAGAQWQKEQMIDKACEWLENLFAPDGSIIPENIKRIEDFKNYMK